MLRRLVYNTFLIPAFSPVSPGKEGDFETAGQVLCLDTGNSFK